MPRGDKTGPQGCGPRTGWGCGRCGWGMGWHHAPCWGFGRYQEPRNYYGKVWTKKEEQEALKNEMESLEESIKEIKARLSELQS